MTYGDPLVQDFRLSRDPNPRSWWSAGNQWRWFPASLADEHPCPWSWLVGPVRETPQ